MSTLQLLQVNIVLCQEGFSWFAISLGRKKETKGDIQFPQHVKALPKKATSAHFMHSLTTGG